MIELFVQLNVWHQPVKTCGDWGPFGMLFADTLFCVDFQIDLLVLSEFSDENVVM